MEEAIQIGKALRSLLPFFTLKHNPPQVYADFYIGLNTAFILNPDPNYTKIPNSQDDVTERDILQYCLISITASRLKNAKIENVSSQDLNRLFVYVRIKYLIDNVDADKSRQLCIFSVIKQHVKSAASVSERADEMKNFISKYVVNSEIDELTELYNKIYLALDNNKAGIPKTIRALNFVSGGELPSHQSTLSDALSAIEKGMTTLPYEREASQLRRERNNQLPADALSLEELEKCGKYRDVFEKYLPKLKEDKSSVDKCATFIKVLRNLLAKYHQPIQADARDELDKRLNFAAAKVATALERVKGKKFVMEAAAIRSRFFPAYAAESTALTVALQKNSSLAATLNRDDIIKSFLVKVIDWSKNISKLLGFEFSGLPEYAKMPEIDVEGLQNNIIDVAQQLQQNPDAVTQRDRFLRRIDSVMRAYSGFQMTETAKRSLSANEEVASLLEPEAELVCFMHKTRAFARKADKTQPNSYFNLHIANDRAAAVGKLAKNVNDRLTLVQMEVAILKQDKGDSQRIARLGLIEKSLQELQNKLSTASKPLTGEELLAAQGQWQNCLDAYEVLSQVNLAQAFAASHVQTADPNIMPKPAQGTKHTFT